MALNIVRRLPAILVVAVVVGGVGLVASRVFWPAQPGAAGITVPRLSPLAAKGEKAFAASCATCHGVNAAGGTGKAPPLIHEFYNPGHHGDGAFVRAARSGVPQHHWRFGDMPPRPEVSDDDLVAIIRYVRELQIANGITYQPHNM